MSDRQTMVNTMERGKLRSTIKTVILSGSERCIMNWKYPVMFFMDCCNNSL